MQHLGQVFNLQSMENFFEFIYMQLAKLPSDKLVRLPRPWLRVQLQQIRLSSSPARQELWHAPFNLMRQTRHRGAQQISWGLGHLQLMLRDSDNLTMPHRHRDTDESNFAVRQF